MSKQISIELPDSQFTVKIGDKIEMKFKRMSAEQLKEFQEKFGDLKEQLEKIKVGEQLDKLFEVLEFLTDETNVSMDELRKKYPAALLVPLLETVVKEQGITDDKKK